MLLFGPAGGKATIRFKRLKAEQKYQVKFTDLPAQNTTLTGTAVDERWLAGDVHRHRAIGDHPDRQAVNKPEPKRKYGSLSLPDNPSLVAAGSVCIQRFK